MNEAEASSQQNLKKQGHYICVCVCFFVHVMALVWMAWSNSPVHNEVAHLPAGLSHWKFWDFRLYRENPPFVRMLATLPLLAIPGVEIDTTVDSGPYSRPEFGFGERFARRNGRQIVSLFRIARIACIPLSVLGAWVCYRWSVELYGSQAGLIALSLWCFCPNVLAWGSAITPDLGAASLGLAANYSFWAWMRRPSPRRALTTGLLLGLAELTKSTWLLLFLIWPFCWYWRRVQNVRDTPTTGRQADNSPPSGPGLLGIMLMGLCVLNWGYGFEATGRHLADYRFISRTLGGVDAHEIPGNRFRGTILASLPVFLPEDYVCGVDSQKHDFERQMLSYLGGEFRTGGWWYYYVYGLLVKTPSAVIVLFLLACFPWRSRRAFHRELWSDVTVYAPAIAGLLLVSSQTGFNQHLRYVLPFIPYAYIFVGRLGGAECFRKPLLRRTVYVLLLFGAVESLFAVPHSISFFNTISGGPLQGYRHLLDSNIDWGQDLLHLKKWQDEHPEAVPLHVATFGSFPTELTGIQANLLQEPNQPLPSGWYAISVNRLHGYGHHIADDDLAVFRTMQPVDRAGYSISILRVD